MLITLPKDIIRISEIYKKAGKELYVVGGAVRDALLGIEPKDIDLATDAEPDESIALLEKKFKVKEVGKAFGVIEVIVNGEEIQIARFREDIGSGRRPDSVKFSTIETDVLRRDLTVNALFYNIHTDEIVDLVGGKKDLEARIIRAVGVPEERFEEDPLRRLRAVRFYSILDGELAPNVYESLKNNSDISTVSKDRIKDEMDKLIDKTKNLTRSLELLHDLGFLNQIFPELDVKIDKIGNLPITRYALILRDNIDEVTEENKYPMKRIQKTLNKLRFSIDEINTICYLVRLVDLSEERAFFMKKAERRTVVKKEEVEDFLRCFGIDDKLIKAYLKYEITVDPNDLEAQGFKHKPLGDEMERLETIRFKEIIERI